MPAQKETPLVPETAAEMRDKLRARHPATQMNGPVLVPGGWTCVEEYEGLDLLAFSAHATPQSGAQRPPKGARYPRVGYEIKVSRADLRQELLRPHKRRRARAICHELYLAVPKGLLKPEEIAFAEPPHFQDAKSFQRRRCPNKCAQVHYKSRRRTGPHMVYREDFEWGVDDFETRYVVCPVCAGKGYLEKSRAEIEGPQLWVPADMGLIEVADRCYVVKPAPVNKEATLPLDDRALGDLVRWVSARPDPRHAGVIERARERTRSLRARSAARRGRRRR